MAGNRLQGRSRLGIDPAIRDIVKYIETTDTTTEIDITDSINMLADNQYIAWGAAGNTDSYVMFDGTDLLFFDSRVAGTKTLTELAAAAGATLDEVFDNGKVINGATTQGNAMSVGGATDFISFWQEGANDVRVDTSTGANLNLDAAGGQINVLSDTTKLGFGASGTTDGYVFHDGTSLTFYDSEYGSEIKLKDMAGSSLNSPTVTGDMTVTDGKIVQVDATDEVAYSVTSSSTTNDVIRAIGDSTSSGAVLAAYATDATLAGGGFYLRAYGGASNLFTVGRYGATVIAGTAAGTDALTLTTGDATLSSGDLAVTIGTVTVADTADSANKISRNNATGTAAVLEVEQTHATGGVGLLVDQNATGDVNAVEITNAGTGYAMTTTGGAAGSEGYEFIAAASATGIGFLADGTTNTWIGAAATGMITAKTDGALADVAASLVYLAHSGNAAGASQVGSCINVVETGASSGTSYAVGIASTSNEALSVTAGESLFAEKISISLADDFGPALVVTNPDTTGDTNAVEVVPSGAGAGLAITPQEVDTIGVLVTTVASSAVSLIDMDLTTGAGWIGADGEGAVRLTSDGTNAHANASLINVIKSGATAAAMDGSCLRIDDASTGGATAGYAVSINASGALEALHVDAGTVVVDETVQAVGGVLTAYDVTDIADPPTQANMDAAFVAGSSAVNGMLGIINDADGGAAVWLCVCANDAWYYAAKLTIGA